MPPMIWNRKKNHRKPELEVRPKTSIEGYQFSLKGSPRFFTDVHKIITDSDAHVYFSEPLAYERGAAIALWRVRAAGFDWLPKLYDYWVEMERTEPIVTTFHLYLPGDDKYPVLDLRDHSPAEVEAFIRENAPIRDENPYTGLTRRGPRPGFKIP